MPRLTKSLPKYRRHKARGQAVVTLSGRDIYLGPHGSKLSRTEFDRVVAEWIAGGRSSSRSSSSSDLSVAEIMVAYLRHAASVYIKNGKPTSDQAAIRAALRPVR